MGCAMSEEDMHGQPARLQKQEKSRQQQQTVPLDMSLESDHWTEEAPLKETVRVLKQIVMVARCGIPDQEVLFCDRLVGLWFCGYRLDDDKTVEQCQELCSVCSAVCILACVYCGAESCLLSTYCGSLTTCLLVYYRLLSVAVESAALQDAQVSVEGVEEAKNAIAARIKEEERVRKVVERQQKFEQFRFMDEDGDSISITRQLSLEQQAHMKRMVDTSSQDLPTFWDEHQCGTVGMNVNVSGHGDVGQWGGFNAQTGAYAAGGGSGVVPSDMQLQLSQWLEMTVPQE